MIKSGGFLWIQNEGDNEIRQGSFETVLLNNMNIKMCPSKRITYYNDIFKTSCMDLKNLCYHIDEPVVIYVFKIVRYILRQYGYVWNPSGSSACFLK